MEKITSTNQPTFNKKPYIIGGSVIVVGLLAGYFFAVPAIQIGQQKHIAAKHQLVNDKLGKVYDSFKRDAFTKADAQVGTAKTDVKVALDASKDARSSLDTNAPELTKFKAWPLLNWNNKYKAATKLDAQEEKFVKDSRTFLAEYDGMLAYADKSLDAQSELEKAMTDLASLSENDTPAQMIAKLDATSAKLQPVVDRFKAMTVPAFLKADHDKTVVTLNQLISALKDLSTGVKDLDLDKLTAVQNDITRITTENDANAQAFITMLQRDSIVSKQIDGLRNLNNEVDWAYAKL